MTIPANPLGDLDVETFLRDHWQRTPLLIRGAFPGFADPLSPEELAGLALEDDVEARIVQEKRGRFTLRRGPFAEADFTGMPDKRWTLLVQAVDQLLPGVAALRTPFRFLPDWRIDDVMISYAAPGGSVGPHWDNYDVFLLQGRGKRRWLVGDACGPDSPHVAGADLRLLDGFEVRHDWVLEAGDMLYLPPRFAHHGIALDACMTYSIGFRAPSAGEALLGVAAAVADDLPDVDRYADPGIARPANPGAIDDAALDRLAALIADRLNDRAALADWLGRFVTEPKYEHSVQPRRRRLSAAAFAAVIAEGRGLARTPGARFAFRDGENGFTFFVNGEAQTLGDTAMIDMARRLCAEPVLDAEIMASLPADGGGAILLLALINGGSLEPT